MKTPPLAPPQRSWRGEEGSPVIADGEQTKPSFATYPVHGLENLAADGVQIPFADGHVRQLPRLTAGPFRYKTYAEEYLQGAQRYATKPVRQAVISASALSLLYPGDEIEGYPRDRFVADLLDEHERDIRRCLARGAHNVQVDFTEGRLAVKLDPSRGLLKSFVDLNNRVLGRFSPDERQRIGVHTCPGGDRDSTHSADVDYAELLPSLFELKVGSFYVQLASEKDRPRVLRLLADLVGPGQRVFVGVTDPIDPRVESAEEVRDRVLEAAEHLPLASLGTTDAWASPVWGRHLDLARDRFREDPGAGRGDGARRPAAGGLRSSWETGTDRPARPPPEVSRGTYPAVNPPERRLAAGTTSRKRSKSEVFHRSTPKEESDVQDTPHPIGFPDRRSARRLGAGGSPYPRRRL